MTDNLKQLTKAYYDGTATGEQLGELNFLIADSETSRKEFSSYLRELEAVRPMDLYEQRAFSRVISRIDDRKAASHFKRIIIASVSAAAAVVLSALLWTAKAPGTAPEYTEFHALSESSCAVTLPDSSEIVLFSGSKLLKPSDFSATSRKVSLIGEACFDITSDKANPFVIDAGNECSVTVRGTKFDLSAPENGETIRLTLLRGAVDFSGPDMEITMSPGESLTYSKLTGDCALYHVDIDSYEAWLEGNLEFHELPFEELVEKIGSLYGRKLVLDNSLKSKRGLYSIRLVNRETLEDVIGALDVMTPLSARFDSSYVYLSSTK